MVIRTAEAVGWVCRVATRSGSRAGAWTLSILKIGIGPTATGGRDWVRRGGCEINGQRVNQRRFICEDRVQNVNVLFYSLPVIMYSAQFRQWPHCAAAESPRGIRRPHLHRGPSDVSDIDCLSNLTHITFSGVSVPTQSGCFVDPHTASAYAGSARTGDWRCRVYRLECGELFGA